MADAVLLPLPWHEPVLADLHARLRANTLPNAIALTCSPGWGLDHLAARLVGLCLDLPEYRQEPNQLRELAHPDLRWIEPDGAELKIDQVRLLNDFAVQTAQIAPRKVAVLCAADQLNENAANALLKTLEEPPPDTHLVLLTHNWGRLLPTVRSRTQRWPLREDHSAALEWLNSQDIPMDEVAFEVCGAAPLQIWQGQSELQAEGSPEASGAAAFDITHWLTAALQRSVSASASQAADLDPAVVLSLWYRRIKLHLSYAPIPGLSVPARVLHEFADQLLSVRRQIMTRNSARSSANLMLEGLLIDWRRISSAAGG